MNLPNKHRTWMVKFYLSATIIPRGKQTKSQEQTNKKTTVAKFEVELRRQSTLLIFTEVPSLFFLLI